MVLVGAGRTGSALRFALGGRRVVAGAVVGAVGAVATG